MENNNRPEGSTSSLTIPPWFTTSQTPYSLNCVTRAPGLEVATSAHLTAQNANTFYFRQGSGQNYYINGVAANTVFPTLTGTNLAFDNGSQPQSTNSCRVYTFLAKINNPDSSSPTVTLSVIQGADFPKHQNQRTTDYNNGDGTQAIVGYLSIKNESSAVFIPGTTALNASGITAIAQDAFGFLII